jgi:protein tyrosine/serine phosphatase
MKTRISVAAIFAFGFVLATFTAAQDQKEARYKELPNFHPVNSNLYRGGQPEIGGLEQLKKLGVKTIINLRDDDERARAEKAEAESMGFRYFNIPFASFDRPSDKAVDEVLKLIDTQENSPLFIHCKRGSDRTGTVIAIYRIEHDGWDGEKAKAEAKRYGMGFWQVGMKDYIHDYYDRKAQRSNDASSTVTAKPTP